ncbi:MAG: diphosphomevalonate decarboxylase [Phototrophicaceae bacterium]
MQHSGTAHTRAFSNIAFIKYWGNHDHRLRLPVSSSISMNLSGLYSETVVEWGTHLEQDSLVLNGQVATPEALSRIVIYLDLVRELYGFDGFFSVSSSNTFPTGAGIASSASGFGALAYAVNQAVGLQLTERELSTLARLGSGSASRSIPAGFVQWHQGYDHASSYAETIAPVDHWELVDVIAIISKGHKAIGSTEGHGLASTSVLQQGRLQDSEGRFERCKQSLLSRDFDSFSEVVEYDSNLMHAVMMTSNPPLFYWQPGSIEVMHQIRQWRKEGIGVCFTLDAGPNVHCICLSNDAPQVQSRLRELEGVIDVLVATPAGAAHSVEV